MPPSEASGAVTVAVLARALDEIAPLRLAAEWDNVGLLAGVADRAVRLVLLAIDLTDAVAREALQRQADALLLYHPPIFKGIQQITATTPGPTTMLPELLAGGVALLAVHTALDHAPGGTNDCLLDAFDLTRRFPLEPIMQTDRHYKLVVFVPPAESDALRTALAAAGAGQIGAYGECSFEIPGRGSFRGGEGANPVVGQAGRLEFVDELRLEMVVPKQRLAEVVRALYATHRYEEPAFDIYPLESIAQRAQFGSGRVGELRMPTDGPALLRQLGKLADLSAALVIGELNRPFERVIAAAGSFGSGKFRDPGALVVTGELKHHDALELARRGVTAVCIGHDASERPALAPLANRLRAAVPGCQVELARADGPIQRPLRTVIESKEINA